MGVEYNELQGVDYNGLMGVECNGLKGVEFNGLMGVESVDYREYSLWSVGGRKLLLYGLV